MNMVLLIGIGIVLAIFSWGLLWHNSSILFETLYRGDRSKKKVALTFDDGPDPVFTPQVLDILREYNARATFFCVGRLAEMYPDIVKRIHMEGHLIANHSYEHSWPMYLWIPSRVRSSIGKTGNILEGITGVFPGFYRPPVGIKTPPQILTVWRMGLRFVGWNLWALDGGRRTLTMEKTRSLVDKAKNGDVFLLHDGKLNVSGRVVKNETHGAAIAECLPELLKGLQSRGYELVSLDKLITIAGTNISNPLTGPFVILARIK